MGIEQSFPFTTPGNYSYDSAKISVSGGKAQLILGDLSGRTFNQPFDSDAGFTYDSGKTEFSGGQVQQKDNGPANATCWATFASSINLTAGDGVLTGSGVGGAAVSGGKLDLKYSDVRYVDYDANSNADSVGLITIKFKLTPNYSGFPSADRYFFTICQTAGSNINMISLYHSTSGGLSCRIGDSAGSTTIVSFGTWSPTASVEYEFELNCDFSITNERKLFVDGSQQGPTNFSVKTRSSDINLLRIGSNNNAAATSNFEIDDFVIFSNIQHTTNYTPGYTLPNGRYEGDTITLPDFVYPGLGNIQSFTGFTVTDANSPRYIINGQYWNGSIWTASDGSYAQANSAADINTNIGSLTAADTVTVKIITQDGVVLMSCDDLTLTYTGQGYGLDNPTIKPGNTTNMDDLLTFLATVTETGSDAVKFTIEVDGTEKYWTGSAWANSSGYAQSNTAAEINTNATTLLSAGSRVRPVVYLHSNDGTTTPNIDIITWTYDFYSFIDDNAETCYVYDFIKDAENNAVSGATITAVPRPAGNIKDKNIYINKKEIVKTSAADGYWEMNLIKSNQYAVGVLYDFILDYSNGAPPDIIRGLTIPDQDSVSFGDLT